MNFKLKFHTSAPTALEPYEILANIQFELKDKKYIGKNVTERSISFKNDFRGFRSGFSPIKLDEGQFEIIDDPGSGRLLTLNYRYNYGPQVLIVTAVTIIAAFSGEYIGILFIGAFFSLALAIDIACTKSAASELLANVLKT